MEISPKVLGFIRSILGIAIWGAAMSVLTFFSDATHLNGFVDGSLATLIAGVAGALEHSMAANGQGAIFGAIPQRIP